MGAAVPQAALRHARRQAVAEKNPWRQGRDAAVLMEGRTMAARDTYYKALIIGPTAGYIPPAYTDGAVRLVANESMAIETKEVVHAARSPLAQGDIGEGMGREGHRVATLTAPLLAASHPGRVAVCVASLSDRVFSRLREYLVTAADAVDSVGDGCAGESRAAAKAGSGAGTGKATSQGHVKAVLTETLRASHHDYLIALRRVAAVPAVADPAAVAATMDAVAVAEVWDPAHRGPLLVRFQNVQVGSKAGALAAAPPSLDPAEVLARHAALPQMQPAERRLAIDSKLGGCG